MEIKERTSIMVLQTSTTHLSTQSSYYTDSQIIHHKVFNIFTTCRHFQMKLCLAMVYEDKEQIQHSIPRDSIPIDVKVAFHHGSVTQSLAVCNRNTSYHCGTVGRLYLHGRVRVHISGKLEHYIEYGALINHYHSYH